MVTVGGGGNMNPADSSLGMIGDLIICDGYMGYLYF